MGRRKKTTDTGTDKYFDISGQAFVQGPNIVQPVSKKGFSLVTNQPLPGLGLIPLSVLGKADYDKDPRMGNELKVKEVIVAGLDMTGLGSNPVAVRSIHIPDIATVRIVRNENDYGDDIETVHNVVDKLRANTTASFPAYDYSDIQAKEKDVRFTKALFRRYIGFFGDIKGGDPVYGWDASNKRWASVANPAEVVDGFGMVLDNIGRFLMFSDYMDYLDANMSDSLLDRLVAKGGKANPDINWFDLVAGNQFDIDADMIEALVDEWYADAANRSIVNLTKADIRIWVRFKYYYKVGTFRLFNAALDQLSIDKKTYDIKNETKDEDVSWMFSNKMWSICRSMDVVLRDSDGDLVSTELMLAVWSWYRKLKEAAEAGVSVL